MKKIKKKISKRRVSGIPHIGLYLHVEQRFSLAHFSLQWLHNLKTQLSGEVELSIWVSAEEDQELDDLLSDGETTYDFRRLIVTQGLSRGRKLNEGLQQLQVQEELDAVIPIAPGDLLTAQLLRVYGEHLKSGGLFSGLLDQYLYDPSSLRCMHWARAEYYEGSKRACELGIMIARPMLDALKWQLWPSSSDQGLDALHTGVMERMSEVFSLAPPKTCILQSMQAYGAPAVSLKSELGRVLFDEGNWQKLPGLSFADFELIFEDHLGADWLEKIDTFDERVSLDILIEAPPHQATHESLWRKFHQFLPLKFDPYARVKLHVICSEDEAEEISGWGAEWSPLVIQSSTESSDVERWNEAIDLLYEMGSEVLLIGGKGSIVDMKTIEHYLIYLFKMGARLMSASNFFVSLTDERQGGFWPGVSNASFAQIFGFGTCVHRAYLEKLGPSPLGAEGGLKPEAASALDALLKHTHLKHQRVMFQCISHKLGLIAFDPEGAIGFSPRIRLADLKYIKISEHLPGPALTSSHHRLLTDWEQGIELTSASSDFDTPLSVNALSPVDSPETTGNHMSQSNQLSPLERAKALLKQTNRTATPASSQEADSDQPAPQATLSPLERAKALLKGSQGESASAPAPAPSPALSPLERAKALLKQSQESAAPAPQADPTPAPVKKTLCPLERAKALLSQSQRAEDPTEDEIDVTQEAINQAVKGAEMMVEQLQQTLHRAQSEEADSTAQRSTADESPSPADLICKQGEDLYASGHEEKATALFESALLVDPSCSRALNNLGVIALSSDEPWKALSYLLMGLIQEPQNEDILVNLHGVFDLHPEMSAARAVIFN